MYMGQPGHARIVACIVGHRDFVLNQHTSNLVLNLTIREIDHQWCQTMPEQASPFPPLAMVNGLHPALASHFAATFVALPLWSKVTVTMIHLGDVTMYLSWIHMPQKHGVKEPDQPKAGAGR